jgi:hypothetical protein
VRLLSAIIVLMLSVASLAVGIALRTVWAGPDTLVKTIEIDHTAPAIVIPGSTLVSNPGRQTVTVLDNTNNEAGITLVYGRTVDLMGWLRPARFTTVLTDSTTGELYAAPRLGSQSRVPNPLNSDLWLEQFHEQGALKASLTGDQDISVAVFMDGSYPAPGTIQLSWPLDNVSPLAGFLVAAGILALVIGVVLLVMVLTDVRRRRGPRQKLPKAPKRRSPRAAMGQRRTTSQPSRGRRRMRRTALAMPVIGVLALGACAPASTAEPAATVDDTATTLDVTPLAPYPAVTQAQFQRILERIANHVLMADQALDGDMLSQRLSDPALSMRGAQYILRGYDSDLGQISPIPTSPIRLLVPQQTREWPRTVFAIVQQGAEANSPAVGIVLRQETARTNYQLIYEVLLAPDVVLPAMPLVDIGSPRLARDSKLLPVSPEDTIAHYGAVLSDGPDAQAWSEFDVLTDNLYALVGPDGQALRQESFGSDLEMDLSIEPTDQQIVALATRDGGALVFGVLRETETVRPVESGAAINATPAVRAITGEPQSSIGFEASYDMHIVWYVPAVGSDEKIRVVGYSYGLVDAAELDE